MDRGLPEAFGNGDDALIRLAAVGDIHAGSDSAQSIRMGFENVAREADVLLIAGDLTQHGYREEARVLADELAGISIPIVAVLGNHDYHQQAERVIRSDLEQVGVTVLEGDGAVIPFGPHRLGVAGVKGFGGGFAGACASEFGEDEMKAFVRETKGAAARLRESLGQLDGELRIALTHYAPIPDTLLGERLEVYPFLGSYLLGEAIDEVGCDLVLHGHAHLGTEHGITPGGIPVRNVARPVIQCAYKVYCLSKEKKPESC